MSSAGIRGNGVHSPLRESGGLRQLLVISLMEKGEMQEQTAADHTTPIDGERGEIDYLCTRFPVSRSTASNIVQTYSGDRHRMEQEAERLAIYERLHRRRERG